MNAQPHVLVAALFATAALAGCSAKSSAPPAEYGGYGEGAPMAETADAGGDGARTYQQYAPGAVPSPAPSPAAPGEAYHDSEPTQRPGLATSWGESRQSRVTTSPFVRADKTSPFAVGKLFYNDPAGIDAMTNGGGAQQVRRFALGVGHVDFSLRDESGNFLTGYKHNSDNYVAGVAGRRYSIVIKNHSPGRIEVVASVDGLDVIDGKSASMQKRGYLVDPYGELEIEGFRTSTSEVAAFRFGSVDESYAEQKHGDTRNVGVIGVAVFHERGDSPSFWGTPTNHEDANDRRNANPFPEYATPP